MSPAAMTVASGPPRARRGHDLSEVRAWIVTDGKAGDENQCVGLAETLGLGFEARRVSPRPPFGWLAPW
ncbi:MAG TPA: nucleoside-diphosphate sugar epimerase, partial [Methylobacterium sp.]